MNLKRFKRELRTNQNLFQILTVRRNPVSKKLHIDVRYQGPEPSKFSMMRDLGDKHYKEQIKELYDVTLHFLPHLRPRVTGVRFNPVD